jgi:uncharacterized protein with HEPN domain
VIRDPAICLGDMLDYACDIQTFIAGMDASAFANDRKTQYAVLRALEVIGEAAKRIPPETQARFADIPWRQIVGMRNVIAHDYLGIRLSRIYETATVFIPQLQSRLPDMIAELESDRRAEDAGRS